MGAERRGNPFGWILLGFAVGVLATFGVILFLTAGLGGYDEGPEMRTAAAAAIGTASAAPAPRKIETPVVATPPATTDVPDRETPPVDAQMADDAAASGMTSRASPDRPAR